MADNTDLDAGTGGDKIVTREISHGGDTAKLQGVFAMGITGTEGAYTAAAIGGDATNGLDVDVTRVTGTVTVDGSGVTQPVSHAALTELAAAINASNQMDVNVAAGTVAVTNAGLTELAAAINASSQLDVNIAASAATLTVASHAVTNAGTFAVQVTSVAAGDNNIGNVDIVTLPALAAGTNNIGDVDVLSIAAGNNNIGDVDVASIAAGDNNIGNVDVVSLPASTNTLEVVGDVAHDAAAAGNPVQTGGYATNSIEGLTQVAAADLTRTVHDLNGVQVVRPHTTLEELLSERVSNTNGTSTDFTTFAAGGSGIHNYITNVTIWNSSATDGYVDFRDGSAGSIKWTFPAPQTGGCVVLFNPPLKFADNTAVAFDVSAAISTVYISVNGFQAQG